MLEYEQTVSSLRRSISEMSRGMKLMADAEWMAGFGTAIWDLETNELWLSEGLYKIIGRKRTSKFGVNEMLETVIRPEDMEQYGREMADTANGDRFDAIRQAIRPDGEVRHLHAKAQRIDGDNGHPPVVLITVVDVTPDP